MNARWNMWKHGCYSWVENKNIGADKVGWWEGGLPVNCGWHDIAHFIGIERFGFGPDNCYNDCSVAVINTVYRPLVKVITRTNQASHSQTNEPKPVWVFRKEDLKDVLDTSKQRGSI